MSDRKIAKTVYRKFRGAMTSPLGDERPVVDILIEAIQAERERCALRVEDLGGESVDFDNGITRAMAAIRKGGN